MNNWFELAKVMAKKSELNIRVGAVLVKKNRVIAVGFNKSKTHPIVKRFDYSKGGRFKNPGIHGEVDCVLRSDLRDGEVVGAKMYVVRINKSGEFVASKPCLACLSMLKSYGVDKVLFYDKNIEVCVESFRG